MDFSYLHVQLDFTINEKKLLNMKNLILAGYLGAGSAIGLLLSCPLIITDFNRFKMNISTSVNHPTLGSLYSILTNKSIAWDLINTGGFNSQVCSCLFFAALVCINIFRKKDMISFIINSSCLLSLLFILTIFSARGYVYGWYFFPLVFMISLCLSPRPILWIILTGNIAMMFPYVSKNISFKYEQFRNIRNLGNIEDIINEYTDENLESVCFIDVSRHICDKYPITYEPDYDPDCDQVLFISRLARRNNKINTIYESAYYEIGGYRIAYEDEILTVVYHDKSDQE